MSEVAANVAKYGVPFVLVVAGLVYNILFLILGFIWAATAVVYDLEKERD